MEWYADMKWLIVILFATMEGDIYVFENPSFETEKACREFIMDRQQVPNLTQKLLDFVFGFNVGPYKSGGSTMTVNKGEYEVLKSFDQSVGASFRRIVDLSNMNFVWDAPGVQWYEDHRMIHRMKFGEPTMGYHTRAEECIEFTKVSTMLWQTRAGHRIEFAVAWPPPYFANIREFHAWVNRFFLDHQLPVLSSA